jgi:hypothetical protein
MIPSYRTWPGIVCPFCQGQAAPRRGKGSSFDTDSGTILYDIGNMQIVEPTASTVWAKGDSVHIAWESTDGSCPAEVLKGNALCFYVIYQWKPDDDTCSGVRVSVPHDTVARLDDSRHCRVSRLRTAGCYG